MEQQNYLYLSNAVDLLSLGLHELSANDINAKNKRLKREIKKTVNVERIYIKKRKKS